MEAVAGLGARHRGVHPDMPVTEFGLFGERSGGEFFHGIEFGHSDMRKDQCAFFPDEQGPRRGQFVAEWHLCELFRWLESSVVPCHWECSGGEFVRWEQELNGFQGRPDVVIDPGVLSGDG